MPLPAGCPLTTEIFGAKVKLGDGRPEPVRLQGDDVDIVSIRNGVGRVRNWVGAEGLIAHAARDIKGVATYHRVPGQAVIRVGNWDGLLEYRRACADVVDKDILIGVERVKERERLVKNAVEAACQHGQKFQVRIDCGADRLACHPFHGRHIGIVGVGHHHARVEKLKTGARSCQRIDGLGHVRHGLVRVVDRDGQRSSDRAGGV